MDEEAAVAELRQLVAGRSDLLAEVCGIMTGASEGELDQPLKPQAAEPPRHAPHRGIRAPTDTPQLPVTPQETTGTFPRTRPQHLPSQLLGGTGGQISRPTFRRRAAGRFRAGRAGGCPRPAARCSRPDA
jgi:hypothetical protein